MTVKTNEAVNNDDHIMQSLADKDINAKVSGDTVHVHKDNVTKAKAVLKKLGQTHSVKGGLNEAGEIDETLIEAEQLDEVQVQKRDFVVHYTDKDGKKKTEKHSSYSPRGIVRTWPSDRKKEFGHTLVDIKHNGKSVMNEALAVIDESADVEGLTIEDYTAEELLEYMDTEAFGQLDEVSARTLSSYISKASLSVASGARKQGIKIANGEDISKDDAVANRIGNITKAAFKLSRKTNESFVTQNLGTFKEFVEKSMETEV